MVEIFDVYRGKGIQEGYKSIAVSISYRSKKNIIRKILPIHRQVLDQLSNKLDAY